MEQKTLDDSALRGSDRQASAKELLELLRRPSELFQSLRLNPAEAQLSFPTGGRSPRLKVSVKRGELGRVPRSIVVDMLGEKVGVAVEADEDFQDYTY